MDSQRRAAETGSAVCSVPGCTQTEALVRGARPFDLALRGHIRTVPDYELRGRRTHKTFVNTHSPVCGPRRATDDFDGACTVVFLDTTKPLHMCGPGFGLDVGDAFESARASVRLARTYFNPASENHRACFATTSTT